jgi:phenylacetate-coenzyme A ligase PaaK-like adenylate-forming protein
MDKLSELDRLKVKVEHAPGQQDLVAIRNKVEETLYQKLGVESEVEVSAPESLEKALFKAQRMIHTYK